MKQKLFSLFFLLFVVGFTFFYTNKAVILARKSDPIMKKIIEAENVYKIDKINPIINDDEYVYGLNGCVIDEENSYNKMKNIDDFDENLIVLKEDEITNTSNNKYIISGNKEYKNISIIILVSDEISSELLNFIENKKIKINFFIDGNFLEKNLEYIEKLKNYGNIYNLGRNNKYLEKYISYDNNLINSISNNESKYCILNKKDKETLDLCNKNNMEVIKSRYIKENILSNIKYTLNNGDIIVIENANDNLLSIKVTINYIMSKGYNIININDLLKTKKNCDIISSR